MSSTATIDTRSVSKWYGNLVAVNDVTLQVGPGITGLLGPNGAGKTTLLNLITGLAAPSEGEVTVLGEPVRDNTPLYRRIGFMPGHEALYDVLTARQFIEMAAVLYGLDPVGPAVDRAFKYVALTDVQHRSVSTFSRGMRQRTRLAASLVHDPEVLLLDEPMNGTDPQQRIATQDLMRRLGAEGRTVLVSSHILEEIETLTDNILLLVAGKLAAAGDFLAIRAKLDERPYQVRVGSSDTRAMAAALIGFDAVDSVSIDEEGALTLLTSDIAELQRSLPRLAKDRGIRLLRVEPLDESLDSVFGYLVEGA